MKTNVYIDGFNLFYGRLKGTPYKWLDLQTFCELALPKLQVNRVCYFTAKLHVRPTKPDQPYKQQTYLRAVATPPKVEVHLGTFLTSVIRQPLVDVDPITGRWHSKRISIRVFNGMSAETFSMRQFLRLKRRDQM